MKNCDYCGEYKKVREKLSLNVIGNHINTGDPCYTFDYICEECDIYEKHLQNKKIEQYKKNRIGKQKDWIKKRDAFLGRDE